MDPASASINITTSNIHPYGAHIIDIVENTQIELKDRIFALNGITPVSRYSRSCLPNRRFCVTKAYNFGDDLTNSPAEMIKKIVPGSPGRIYPAIPIARNTSPNNTKINLVNLEKILLFIKLS